MPATHRIELHKSLLGEQWCNSYLMECASMTEAASFAGLLLTFERNMHRENVRFDYTLVSTVTKFDRVFRHIATNVMGLVLLGTAEYLPLFNTVRVDFSTLDSDPCRKYYRAPVIENDQVNGVLSAGPIANFNSAISTYFFGTTMGDNLYSPKGHVVVSGTVHPQIQMRQLHRRHKKKVVA